MGRGSRRPTARRPGSFDNEVTPSLSPGTRVLYLGDYDLAGGDIEDNTRRVLERYHPHLDERWSAWRSPKRR